MKAFVQGQRARLADLGHGGGPLSVRLPSVVVLALDEAGGCLGVLDAEALDLAALPTGTARVALVAPRGAAGELVLAGPEPLLSFAFGGTAGPGLVAQLYQKDGWRLAAVGEPCGAALAAAARGAEGTGLEPTGKSGNLGSSGSSGFSGPPAGAPSLPAPEPAPRALRPGEKLDVQAFGRGGNLIFTVTSLPPGAQLVAYGIDAAGHLVDGTWRPGSEPTATTLDLDATPQAVARWRVALVAAPGGDLKTLAGAQLRLQLGQGEATLALDDAPRGGLLPLAEVYWRGTWRLGALGLAEAGDLATLLQALGRPDLLPAAPAPAPPEGPLRPGQALKLIDRTKATRLEATLTLTHPPSLKLHAMAIGLDADQKLVDEAWWLVGGRLATPDGAVKRVPGPAAARWELDLAALPPTVATLALAIATEDPGQIGHLSACELTLTAAGAPVATFPFNGGDAPTGTPTLWLGEFYWKGGWRFRALAQPVGVPAGGLAAELGRPDLAIFARTTPARAPGMLVKGQRAALAELGVGTKLAVRVELEAKGRAAFDLLAVGLDDLGHLAGLEQVLGPRNKSTPDGAIRLRGSAASHDASFELDLARLGRDVSRVLFIAVGDGGSTTDRVLRGALGLAGDGPGRARFDFTGADLGHADAAILGEVYHKDGWRFAALGEPLAGALPALFVRAGRPDLAAAADQGPEAVLPLHALLTTSGQTHGFELRKAGTGRPVTFELAWEDVGPAPRRGLFGLATRRTEADLGCQFTMGDGTQGVILPGHGSRADRPPYITLEDPNGRPGLQVHRPELLDYLLVYATLPAGGRDFGQVALDLRVIDPHGGEIEASFAAGPAGRRFVSLVSYERFADEATLRREGSYLEDATEADRKLGQPGLSFVPRDASRR